MNSLIQRNTQYNPIEKLYTFAKDTKDILYPPTPHSRNPRVSDRVDVPGFFQIFTAPALIYSAVRGLFASLKNFDYDAAVQHAFKAIGLPIALVNSVQSAFLIISDLLKISTFCTVMVVNCILGSIFLVIELTLESYKIQKTLTFSKQLNNDSLLKVVKLFDPSLYEQKDIEKHFVAFVSQEHGLIDFSDVIKLQTKLKSDNQDDFKKTCLSLQLIVLKKHFKDIHNHYFNIEDAMAQKLASNVFAFMTTQTVQDPEWESLKERVSIYKHNPEAFQEYYEKKALSLFRENDEKKTEVIKQLPTNTQQSLLLLLELEKVAHYTTSQVDMTVFCEEMRENIKTHNAPHLIKKMNDINKLYLSRHLNTQCIADLTTQIYGLNQLSHTVIINQGIEISQVDIKESQSILDTLNTQVKKAFCVYALGISTIFSAAALSALSFIAAPVAVPITLFIFCSITGFFRCTAQEGFLQISGWHWDLRKTIPDFLLPALPAKKPDEIEMVEFV